MCALALILAGQAAGASDKRRAPDLVVGSVSAAPPVLEPGDRFRVADKVRNAGRRRTGRSTVGYYLSTDRRLDARDVRLAGTRVVGALGAGRSSRGSTTVLVPRSLKAGEYAVLACADPFRRVRERNERNNCAASARSSSVAPPPAAPVLHDRPAGFTNTRTARFVFTSATARQPVRFACRLDGRPFAPCASPVDYANLEEGAHAFLVKARDRDGRESVTSSVEWRVDVTSPGKPALGAHPADPINERTASFSFAGEPEARLECTLDWGPVTVCESPRSYTGLSEGRHVFAVRARDRANNESAFETYGWTVDVTAPAAPTITSGPAALTSSRAATISFASSESGVTHHCSLDGAAFAACSSPQSYGSLPDGAHSFAVKARDPAGNESAARVHSWQVDTTDTGPPTISLVAHPDNPTSSTSAHFQFSASKAVTYRCRLDTPTFSSCPNPVSYTGPLAEGTHTFVVEATDALGQKDTAEYSWRIDTTPPQLGQLLDFPENPSGSQSATFRFPAPEAGAALLCRLDGAAFSTCANPQAYSGLGHGAHRFEAKVRDAAGNESGVRVHRWMVSTTPPPAPGLDLGVYRDGGPAAVRAYKDWLNRPITRVLEYVPGWSWDALASPDETVRRWHLSGYRVVYSTPMLPDSGATLEQGAAGAYDRYFTQLAQTLVRYGQGNSVIRLGWEFNGHWFPWKAKGKTAEFITYWRRIVTAMRSVSAQFSFDWNPAYGPLEFDADQAYPGDAYVDYIGLVVFDQGWEPGYDNPILRWRNFINLPFAMQWHQDFAAQHGKQMTFPEWGLTFRDDFPGHGGGDNPDYVEKMYLWLTANPIAYAIYFEHDKPGSVRHSQIAGHFPKATPRFKQLFGGS